MKNIKLIEKDYKGAEVDSIGISKQTGEYHFIFKKGKKYFGISTKDFKTFVYQENNKLTNSGS